MSLLAQLAATAEKIAADPAWSEYAERIRALGLDDASLAKRVGNDMRGLGDADDIAIAVAAVLLRLGKHPRIATERGPHGGLHVMVMLGDVRIDPLPGPLDASVSETFHLPPPPKD